MYIIGLTGGIASGKSTVSLMLVEQGARLIDADVIARQVVEPGKPAWCDLVEYFGEAILLPNRQINRSKLGEIAFGDEKKRTILEKITHQRIRESVLAEIRKAKEEGCPILVLDVPLLLESGWQEMVDAVWLVYVKKEVQLQRLMERNQFSREQAEARINAQMDLEEKKKVAHVIIDNNGDIELARQQVRSYWAALHKG